MKYSIFIAVTCFLFFSCKKKEAPLPVVGETVFKFMGTIGKDSVNFQAGLDRMFMYTGFFKDTQNLLTLKSYFGKDNCTNCEPYLSFEVKDYDVTTTNGLAGGLSDILHFGPFNSFSLDSVVTTTVVEQFKFTPDEIQGGASYYWDFGDGGSSTQESPTYVFSTGGLKTVQFRKTVGGSVDTMSNVINTDKYSTCRAQFTLTQDSLINFVSVQANPAGLNYSWNFGDGSFGQGQTDSNFYTTNGIFTISLTASSPSCASLYRKKVNFSFLPTAMANFSYSTSNTTLSTLVPRINKSAFIITWIKNGVTYKSFKNVHGINQSGNPIFTFTSIAPYQNDANNNKTVMVTGTVDTYLYNQSNPQDSIRITSNQVVLAAAYPD